MYEHSLVASFMRRRSNLNKCWVVARMSVEYRIKFLMD